MEENGIRERFFKNLTPVVENMHLLKSLLARFHEVSGNL